MQEWDNWSHCALISYALGKIKSFLVEKKISTKIIVHWN